MRGTHPAPGLIRGLRLRWRRLLGERPRLKAGACIAFLCAVFGIERGTSARAAFPIFYTCETQEAFQHRHQTYPVGLVARFNHGDVILTKPQCNGGQELVLDFEGARSFRFCWMPFTPSDELTPGERLPALAYDSDLIEAQGSDVDSHDWQVAWLALASRDDLVAMRCKVTK